MLPVLKAGCRMAASLAIAGVWPFFVGAEGLLPVASKEGGPPLAPQIPSSVPAEGASPTQSPFWPQALERAQRLHKRAQQKAAAAAKAPMLSTFNQIPLAATASTSVGSLYGGRRLFVLLSSSVPSSLARSLAREAKKSDAVLALRGLVEDSFPATLRWNADLGKDVRLWIDPFLFERFAVEAAPTFVWSTEPLSPCSPQTCATPPHLKISGALSLEYALTAMIRGQPQQEPWLRAYLKP